MPVLTYGKNSRFDTDIVNALKELAEKDKPYVKASAVVGLGGLQRVVYRAVTYFSGRRARRAAARARCAPTDGR